MAYELFYTSVARGLRPGTGGFCTVAHTVGMPMPLVRTLEAASAYHGGGHPAGDARRALVTHWRLTSTGAVYNILSCVRPAGLDHTRRPNKLAHHIVLAPRERPPAGPAWVIERANMLTSTWTGEPRLLPQDGCDIAGADVPTRPCTAWATSTGDAGWAGVVAEALLSPARLPVTVLVAESLDALPLASEVIALLPPERRWEATFSTGFVPGAGTVSSECALRFAPTGPGAPRAARGGLGGMGLAFDLTQLPAAPPQGAAAESARRGEVIVPAGRRVAGAGGGDR